MTGCLADPEHYIKNAFKYAIPPAYLPITQWPGITYIPTLSVLNHT